MALLSFSLFVWNRKASWFVEPCLDDFERSSSLSVSVFFTVTFWLMPEVLCFFESILNNNSSLIWHIFVIKSSNIAISLFFCTFLLCFLYWKLETLRVITSDSAVLTNRRLHFQVLKGQHFYFSLSSKFCQNDSGLCNTMRGESDSNGVELSSIPPLSMSIEYILALRIFVCEYC